MKNFKLREQDYKALQGMSEKQTGQFIKGLCGYAFEGKFCAVFRKTYQAVHPYRERKRRYGVGSVLWQRHDGRGRKAVGMGVCWY